MNKYRFINGFLPTCIDVIEGLDWWFILAGWFL